MDKPNLKQVKLFSRLVQSETSLRLCNGFHGCNPPVFLFQLRKTDSTSIPTGEPASECHSVIILE